MLRVHALSFCVIQKERRISHSWLYLIQIQDILKQGVEAPEGQNDLKRMQLRELAALNGTLRDDEILR